MIIYIRTTVHMPEVPGQVEMASGTLHDLLKQLLARLPIADEVINKRTGEIEVEGLFEVLLNGVPHNSLPDGTKTELRDGDVLTLSLILLGGG
jgi:hypothetical protein